MFLQGLGLPGPTRWTSEAVSAHVQLLLHDLAAQLRDEQGRARLEDVEREQRNVSEQEAGLARRHDAWLARLGLRSDGPLDEIRLARLVENLICWQRESARLRECLAVVEQLGEEQRALLAQAAAGLGDLPAPESADALDDALARLEEQRGALARARAEHDATRRTLEEFLGPARRQVSRERRELLGSLGLGEDEEQRVPELLRELERYHLTRRDLEDARAVQAARAATLEGHDELLTLDRRTVEQRLDESRGRAAHRNALRDRIAALETRIEDAKRSTAVADRLADLEEARHAHRDAAGDGDAAAVGGALVDWIQSRSVDAQRPEVFRRADELFVSFTKGTLHLDLDETTSPPRFLARHGNQAGRPVDQLSVGERVQLLMAVRIAFLEQDEVVQLPLLMDEVLGTSDDERAGSMIDTVIEIARRGRQVFYFTAQPDEIGKWIARLDEEGIGHRVLNLAVARGASAASDRPLRIAPVSSDPVPAPAGRDHAAYAEALAVPALDPAAGHLDDLHLWHVIDDVHLLHRLVSRGICSWGQYATLRAHGGAGLVRLDERHAHRIDVNHRTVEEACKAWRVGRSRPVDRGVLADVPDVDAELLHVLGERAAAVDGDAHRFLDSLAHDVPQGWSEEAAVRLRDTLEEGGHLLRGSPLTPGDLRVRVMGVLADEVRSGELDQGTLDRIVGCLPRDPADQPA